MAHNLLSRDSQTGIEMAWHNKTLIVPEINKENCGIIHGGYELQPTYTKDADGNFVKDMDCCRIISLDDHLPVGKAVSSSYGLIENGRIWDMVENALSGTSHKIVSVGTVDNRSKGFISVKLDDDFIAASRNTEPLLNILWGHGGNIKVISRSGFTVTVCQNTFNLNLGRKGKDFEFSVRHTRNAISAIENMETAIENYAGVVAEFKNAMNAFEAQSCDVEFASKVFAGVLTPATFEKDSEVSTRTKNTVNRLSDLFLTGAGNSGKNYADIFNAVTDYYTHESSGGSKKEAKMNDSQIADRRFKQFVSSEFGAGQRAKDEFYNLLLDEDSVTGVVARGEKVLLAMNN